MVWLSLAIAALVVTCHLWHDGSFVDPVSRELHHGNPLAWLAILLLTVWIGVFSERLLRNGHQLRTSLLLLDAIGLIALALTNPNGAGHAAMLVVMMVLTIGWFSVMAADYERRDLTHACFACLLVVPIMAVIAIGLAERLMILGCLYAGDTLYYTCLDPDGRRRW